MKSKIIIGGWYQRTTLHLSEVYEFLAYGQSKLRLESKKLADFRQVLGVVKVERVPGFLEKVFVTTESGIEISYYEDGLYLLEKEAFEIISDQQILKDYYYNLFEPAINYIFSLGAPTPKVLANIKVEHPLAIAVTNESDTESFKVDEKMFGQIYSRTESGGFKVIKTPGYIIVTGNDQAKVSVEELLGMQIFFREFKDQLERYLNIHRTIWEEISDIKEKSALQGWEIEKVRSKLDSYAKTIGLISSRINQMGVYVQTRAKTVKELDIEESLTKLFEYKFEALTDTLAYIKEVWRMTTDYLSSAVQVVQDIRLQTTNNSIQSLQTITTYGVVGGIIGYLSRDSLPKLTSYGFIYFIVLVLLTIAINRTIVWLYRRKRYQLKFSDNTKF